LIAIIFSFTSLKLFFCFWFISLFSSQLSIQPFSPTRLTVFSGTVFRIGSVDPLGILQLGILLQLGLYSPANLGFSFSNLFLLTSQYSNSFHSAIILLSSNFIIIFLIFFFLLLLFISFSFFLLFLFVFIFLSYFFSISDFYS
jgi:hypothetical protein